MKLINDGRFLYQKFSGDWMGQIYKGTGYVGYDNVRKESLSIWFDNMRTGIMQVTGSYDSAKKVLAMAGKHSCPMTNQTHKPHCLEWKIIDENTHVYTSYAVAPGGQECKGMVITYKRK